MGFVRASDDSCNNAFERRAGARSPRALSSCSLYRTRSCSADPLPPPAVARVVVPELFDRFGTLEDEIEPLETALQDIARGA